MATADRPVFVVEDDEALCHGLVEVLSFEKIRAIFAANGVAAIEKLRAGVRPCLILLDLGLPLMSGEEFLKARLLEPELAQIPVVVVTGQAVQEEDFVGLNVDALLRKPISPWKVASVAGNYWHSSRRQSAPSN